MSRRLALTWLCANVFWESSWNLPRGRWCGERARSCPTCAEACTFTRRGKEIDAFQFITGKDQVGLENWRNTWEVTFLFLIRNIQLVKYQIVSELFPPLSLTSFRPLQVSSSSEYFIYFVLE